MKSNLFLLFAITVLFSACSPDKKEAGNAPIPDHFYKRFEGSIGDKKIVLHLNKTGSDYNGVYYADGSWLNLLTDTVFKDSVILFENQYADYYWDKQKQPRIALAWSGNALTGKWISTTKDTVLNVKLTEAYPKGSEKFDIVFQEDSLAAFPTKKGSPKANFSYNFPKATNTAIDPVWRKTLFQKNSASWETGIKALKDEFFQAYTKAAAGEEYYNADSVGGGYLSYSNHTSGYIKYNDKGFVVIDQFRDSYTGGAHGYYFSTMLNFDLEKQKLMTIKDVVTADSVTLQKIIEPFFRAQYNIKAGDGLDKVLFDKHLPPSDNFYFNNNGLAFIYNPYEVASYAQGQLVVFIPFKALEAYLQPEFAKRIR